MLLNSGRFTMKRAVLILFSLATLAFLGGCTSTGGPSRGMHPTDEHQLCCLDFTEVLASRVYPVLRDMPDASGVERHSISRNELCYRFFYHGRPEQLESWLKQNLRTERPQQFDIRWLDDRTVDLIFNGGFE